MPTPRVFARVAAATVRVGTTPGDAALALALTAIVVSETLSPRTMRSPVVATLLAVPVLLTLAWRRRRPLAVAVAVCALSVVLNANAVLVWGAQLMTLPVTLVVYTLAAHASGRVAWVGGLATLALVEAAHVVTADGNVADFIALLVWAGSWFAGRVVRRRTLEAARVATDALLHAQQVEADARDAAARERDRIARELHDVVAHAVSLVVVQAGAERLALGTSAERTRGVLEQIETAGRQALTELRAMLAVLRSADDADGELGPQPDLGDVATLVERVRAAGLDVDLDLDVAAASASPGVGLSAYRIVQEALTNAVKHGSGRARVAVQTNAAGVSIEVRSALPDGRADATTAGSGRGLIGMRERAALHGGTLTTGPAGGEWRVSAWLPARSVAGAS